MFGYTVFEKVFSNLNLSTKKLILRNIFSVDDILVYDISFQEDKIFFRFFDGDCFFQFVFVLKDVSHNQQIYFENRIGTVNKKIFIKNYVFSDECIQDFMAIFVKILLSMDERLIYLLMVHLL